MENKVPQNTTLESSQVFTFARDKVEMSKHNPLDVRPVFGNKWLNNGVNNSVYKRYMDAYDDSPTNQSIINAFVNYIFGDGLVNANMPITGDTPEERKKSLKLNKKSISRYISQGDAKLMVMDYKKFGGYSYQVIYNFNGEPIRIEYIPVYKLAPSFNATLTEVTGYYFCWDWKRSMLYPPTFYPVFDGKFRGNFVEIGFIRRETSEPFFPVPDYFSGVPWAEVEGELANAAKSHFKNNFGALTVINYNAGKMASKEIAQTEAERIRSKYCGTDNTASVIVSFNEGVETATTVDQISPPELNNQNVFYSEEAERKLIVAHSAPPILFAGQNSGTGFSNNAEERTTALKELYRRHINPARENILDGLQDVFALIPDCNIELDLIDFEEETELETKTE